MSSRAMILKSLLVELDRKHTCVMEPTAVQEKVYLARMCGVDLGYAFGWASKPRSQGLLIDLHDLLSDPRFEQQGLRNSQWKVGHEFARKFLSSSPSGVLESEWLTLLSSLHFLEHEWNFTKTDSVATVLFYRKWSASSIELAHSALDSAIRP